MLKLCTILLGSVLAASGQIGLFGLFETTFTGTPSANPYRNVTAEATLARPGGGSWNIPLFWDGGSVWKLRVSPDATGEWTFRVTSNDAKLNGQSGKFRVSPSKSAGGIRAAGAHFARQNGQLFWFLADTGWGYFSDSPEDKHHRSQAEHYAKARASQGFNAIHCMLLSEQGVGNNGGLPFTSMDGEEINPAYWREVDERLAFANRQGLTVGLAIAWGDKAKKEPFAWRRFPNVEARKRYARYVGARYSAYDVYFLVSGEWHGELRTRDNADPEAVFREFVEIGDALDAADPHGRMIGIHPMTQHGSVREFAGAKWMSFADYQQNYNHLHARALLSRRLNGPVVNSEYGYFLRDADGDGVPDKSNSYTVEDMRFSSWDIATAGAYFVTGFGTTYFAGHRDPGPFDVDAAKNDLWEAQAGHVKKFFEATDYRKLIAADELLSSPVPRDGDGVWKGNSDGSRRGGVRPPALTYWAMANPGRSYVVYVRGTTEPVTLTLDSRPGEYRARHFNPVTGVFTDLGLQKLETRYTYRAPDTQDHVVLLEAR